MTLSRNQEGSGNKIRDSKPPARDTSGDDGTGSVRERASYGPHDSTNKTSAGNSEGPRQLGDRTFKGTRLPGNPGLQDGNTGEDGTQHVKNLEV